MKYTFDRPWKDWEETDDLKIARSRWFDLTDCQRVQMATETGTTIQVFKDLLEID